MKFTTNTKPLADSLDLGIINSNVSSFHKKSCVVQITAESASNSLRINIESANICTEIKMKGSCEGEGRATIFVDSLLLKQLVSTLDSSTVTLEFADDGLTIHSGKSKFTLPKMIDSTEFDLTAPVVADGSAASIDIDKSDWKFIKDNQMYAISMAFVHPVYTKVWVSESGDVLVGDIDSERFTHSKKSKLGSTCLLSDTVINLFNSLPDGAKLTKVDRNYLIQIANDSYTYTTQFNPLYESDAGVGDYRADMILNTMQRPSSSIKVSTAAVNKLFNQAMLFTTSVDDTIHLSVENNTVFLKDKSIDGQIAGEGDGTIKFGMDFRLAAIKQVLGNYSDEYISFSPSSRVDEDTGEEELTGIIVWNDSLTTIIAGVD